MRKLRIVLVDGPDHRLSGALIIMIIATVNLPARRGKRRWLIVFLDLPAGPIPDLEDELIAEFGIKVPDDRFGRYYATPFDANVVAIGMMKRQPEYQPFIMRDDEVRYL